MSYSEVTVYWKLPTGLDWTPTSEVTDFEAASLVDGLDSTWWQATSSADQELIFDREVETVSSFLTSVFDVLATEPRGIAYAPDDTLWIIDRSEDKVYNIQLDGTWISEFATSVFDVLALSSHGITYDTSNDTLWLVDSDTDKVYNIQLDGTWISEFATSVFDVSAVAPLDIAYSPDGNLWIIDGVTHKVYNVQTDGAWISEFPNSTFDSTPPTAIQGIAYDTSNNTLWVTDITLDLIYNIGTDGTWISEFPTTAFDPVAQSFTGMTYSPDGTLWMVDNTLDKVFNVSPAPAFNYLAIGAGHNLNDIGASVEWYYSDDAISYTQIGDTYVPKNNKSFVLLISAILAHRAIKVKIINASAAANITSCLIGKKTTLDFADLYDPHRRKGNRTINITEGGRLAGASNKSTLRDIQLKFRSANNTLYDKLDDLWQNNGLRIFFLSWEPTEHSTEVWPVFIDDVNRNAPFVVTGILRNDGIKLKGLYE